MGNVVSTRKNEKLKGSTFLLVKSLGVPESEFIAVDNIGAGAGDEVLVACGSAARLAISEDMPVDAAIVGIIDD